MFDRGSNAVRLRTADVGDRQPAAEQRVFRERLERAAAERRTVDVDRRREQHVAALGARLAGDECSDALEEFGVPARPEPGAAGRAGRRGHADSGQAHPAGTVGTVGQPHGWETEPLDGRGRPQVAPSGQRGFLSEREGGQQIADPSTGHGSIVLSRVWSAIPGCAGRAAVRLRRSPPRSKWPAARGDSRR